MNKEDRLDEFETEAVKFAILNSRRLALVLVLQCVLVLLVALILWRVW